MKSPKQIDAPIEEYNTKEVRFSPLPTHRIRLAGHMKALRKVGALEKGKVYAINLVTDRGMVQIVGDIDRLYPMSAFGHPEMRIGIELTPEDENAGQ